VNELLERFFAGSREKLQAFLNSEAAIAPQPEPVEEPPAHPALDETLL
jgi:hypothetical protein